MCIRDRFAVLFLQLSLILLLLLFLLLLHLLHGASAQHPKDHYKQDVTLSLIHI